MIKAKHKVFWVKFSHIYSKFFLSIAFRNIRYIGDNDDTKKPILVIANHFSWWDGFLQILWNNKFYKRRYHFMMLERELRKSMILTKVGASSITKGTRKSIESLQYLVEVLKNPENMFLFFPQGEIQSIYTDPFEFEKGALNYILRRAKNDFQFIFNVNLIDYSAYRRPELSFYSKAYSMPENATAEDIERDFNIFFRECKTKQRGE